MKKYAVFLLLILCTGCSSEQKSYYEYVPGTQGEVPARISGTSIYSKYYNKNLGNIYITHIDNKELKEFDDGGGQRILGRFLLGAVGANSGKGTEYLMSSGKHIIRANLEYTVTGAFETVLVAQSGEHYVFKAVDVKEGWFENPDWRIWIEDSHGQRVTQEMKFSIGRK